MRNEERKTNGSSLFKPRRVAAKIHSTMTNQFVYCWFKWNCPCDLKIQRSEKNPGWLGICFNVENNDTIDLMEELTRDLKIEIIDL